MRTSGLRATVSGSFRRYMPLVQEAVYELTEMGIEVLSPADPVVVDQFGDFVFVASDKLRSIGLVQRRHFAAIAASDFVWLVSEEGYVGSSASAEIGFALNAEVPVYTDEPPLDLTIRQLVRVVPSLKSVPLDLLSPSSAARGILLDPNAAVDDAHRHLEIIHSSLMRAGSVSEDETVIDSVTHIRELLNH